MSIENESMEEFLERIEGIKKKQVEEETMLRYESYVEGLGDDFDKTLIKARIAYIELLEQFEK